MLRVLLKVINKGDYDWVECGSCDTAWQVPHYAIASVRSSSQSISSSALALYEQKENVVETSRARALLAEPGDWA